MDTHPAATEEEVFRAISRADKDRRRRESVRASWIVFALAAFAFGGAVLVAIVNR